jgi:RTX calcium-binding nonapeptide repeat (4 copies)
MVVALASLSLTLAGPAQATRILGSKASDRIVGSAKADVIRGGPGNDRLNGGRGRDRLFGGRGADRLNAADGRRDRLIQGGPGRDICRIDAADRTHTRGCETVRLAGRRGPGGGSPLGGAPLGGAPLGGAPLGGAPLGGGVPAPGLACATPPEDARVAQDDDPAPTFSDACFATTIALNVSAEEPVGDQVPISIEEVCDVPSALLGEAAQLVGGEGVAIIGPTTQVFDATGVQLVGDAASAALLDADSLSLKAQLLPVAQWGQDEDGAPVPTFAISRADITD